MDSLKYIICIKMFHLEIKSEKREKGIDRTVFTVYNVHIQWIEGENLMVQEEQLKSLKNGYISEENIKHPRKIVKK